MTRALLISRFFPFNAEKVHGIYQRLGTQIEALARVADRIDCLFLVPVDQDCSAEAVREHQERLRQLWSPAISLQFVPTIRDDVPQGLWQRVGAGIFDFHAQLIARPTSTEGALAAVSAALDLRPDIVLAHRLDAMCLLTKLARRSPQSVRGARIFFDMDDIEHVAQTRRLLRDPAWPAQRLLLLQVPTLLLAEVRAMRLATATFVCSEQRPSLPGTPERWRARLHRAQQCRFPPAGCRSTAPSRSCCSSERWAIGPMLRRPILSWRRSGRGCAHVSLQRGSPSSDRAASAPARSTSPTRRRHVHGFRR